MVCHCIIQGCKNPGRHVVLGTKVCKEAPNIDGFSVWNLFLFTLLGPRILKWPIDFLTNFVRHLPNQDTFQVGGFKDRLRIGDYLAESRIRIFRFRY